jgi:hypothetical protein
MILFVELCVDLRKAKAAKDGLYQYKNIAQNTNVGTIEVSIGCEGLTEDFRLARTNIFENVDSSQAIYRARREEGHGGPSQGR